MDLTTSQKHQIKKFLNELAKYKGRHTELVSVYVPTGYEMNKVVNHLSQEKGTAENIKSTSTRHNVIDALERMIQHLKLFKQTPPNGLVAFSGNVAEREGQSDVRVWSLEPPIPLKTRIYRCDKEFVLDALMDMMEYHEAYGLVILDRRDADIGILKGKTIIPVLKTHSHVPGKMKAGGQSSVRFARNAEIARRDHFKKVAEYLKEQFLGRTDIKGILLGGPGPTKYDFVNLGGITTEVKNKIIAIKDLSYTGEFGFQELVDKSQDILAKEDIAAEKKIMQEFFELLATKPGKVSYGEQEVMKYIEMGVVDRILLSEALDDATIDKFEEAAQKFNSETKIISIETREGQQLTNLGKIAAILRYETNNS